MTLLASAALLGLLLFGGAPPAPARPAAAKATATVQDRVVAAAERHLGKPYFFGGRDGRPGCRGVRRCPAGIDCQSLLFFAFEEVFGRRWTRYSVMPSVSAERGELGQPVPGLAGVLRAALRPDDLHKGDVLFFLAEGYNLEADRPLLERDGLRYGVWHTGLVHAVRAGAVDVIHARPGDRVLVQPLPEIFFDALYVLRLPTGARPAR